MIAKVRRFRCPRSRKFRAEYAITCAQGDRGRLFCRRVQCDRTRSRSVAEKFGFAYCSNSEEELLQDANIDAVLIARVTTSRQPGACGDERREGRVLREAAVPERKRTGGAGSCFGRMQCSGLGGRFNRRFAQWQFS